MSKTSDHSRSAVVRRNAKAPARTREEALAIARAALSRISDEEDTAIRAAALADPDAQPAEALPRRKPGRPRAEIKKVAVSLKLDPDVLSAYRAQGPGWQTRMNDDLRKAAKLGRSAR
ncbi:BrnA antitoxin family protein [Mesorhizobium captivum]|uniref:BrnA antitoxin family protein n=1 Tax=Mesorhizobium captivum TaxID=3072319 RepID=A0ABU4YZX7_9HYPH|nr:MULTISPECIES: BrnA antitoxin family protein [unclassified Mesorhizobium]MDX8449130.1 BrnA antitoxin family protein [Mesorhizobium sp. VK3C]MDX8492246.1 BrnA antitoxin family protein [Mesorhizobium sp. VK22B]MDX8506282.1 BrnA antitoxin family protein [Mesorhizobium sp. VK22E]